MRRIGDWTATCKSGWAMVYNQHYFRTHQGGTIIQMKSPVDKLPWMVLYVRPGRRWIDREFREFKHFYEALSFATEGEQC